MKFTCPQLNLLKAINIVTKAVSVRTTIPILRGILMEVKGSTLKLTSSNLDMSIETSVEVTSAEDGSLVVNAKLFEEVIRKLPNALITASGFNDILNINCLGSDMSINGMNSNDYPMIGKVEKLKSFKINKNDFCELVRKTSFSASADEKKGILTGCLINLKEEDIEMVAIDGFRMAIASVPCVNDNKYSIVVPARILNEVAKIFSENEGKEEIEILVDDKRLEVEYEETKIIARLLEGEFLKYEDIIPKECKTSFIINKSEITDSIERASLFTREGKMNLIKLSISPDEIIIKSNSEEGKVNEKVDAQIDGDGLEIGFNSKYIKDALKAASDEEVKFEMTNSISSCLIKPAEGKNYTYLVLPVRIQ